MSDRVHLGSRCMGITVASASRLDRVVSSDECVKSTQWR